MTKIIKKIHLRIKCRREQIKTRLTFFCSCDMCEGIRKLIENGRVEGAAQMVIGFLEELGTIPENVKERILAERDMEMLKKWSRLAARSASIEDFCGKME